jgi:hypothetical protein
MTIFLSTNARPAPSESPAPTLDARGKNLAALSALYASLGGAAWSTNLNWLSPDLDCKTCKQAAPAERWKDRP